MTLFFVSTVKLYRFSVQQYFDILSARQMYLMLSWTRMYESLLNALIDPDKKK